MKPEQRQKLEEQLSAYLDGELTDAERAEVEAFLAQDEQARSVLKELRATVGMVQSMPQAKASAEMMENLRNRLERKALLSDVAPMKSTTAKSPYFRGRLIAAAAVIVLSFVAAYMMRSFTEQPDEGPQYQYAYDDKISEPLSAPKKGTIVQNERKNVAAPSVAAEPAMTKAPEKRFFALRESKQHMDYIESESSIKQRDAKEKSADHFAELPKPRALATDDTIVGEKLKADKKRQSRSYGGAVVLDTDGLSVDSETSLGVAGKAGSDEIRAKDQPKSSPPEAAQPFPAKKHMPAEMNERNMPLGQMAEGQEEKLFQLYTTTQPSSVVVDGTTTKLFTDNNIVLGIPTTKPADLYYGYTLDFGCFAQSQPASAPAQANPSTQPATTQPAATQPTTQSRPAATDDYKND